MTPEEMDRKAARRRASRVSASRGWKVSAEPDAQSGDESNPKLRLVTNA